MKKILVFIFLFISPIAYSLDIDETIRSTIEKNNKVKISIEKMNEAKELIVYSKGEKLPDVTSSISGSYELADKNTATSSTTPETFTDSYKITITQNIYDYGFNNLEIERSKILYNNELINFRLTIQNLIMEAIKGYLSVINYEQSLEATQKNYDSVFKAYEETKTRYDLGSATLYDLQRSEATFAIAQTNLFESEQNLLISKKTFQSIVGLEPLDLEDILNIQYNLDINLIIENAFNDNLSLIEINNQIKEKEILILKEKISKKPSLDLTGTGLYSHGGRLDNGTETTSGSISLTLTVPIFQKKQDNSNIRKFNSQMLQSEIKLEDSKVDLRILLENTYKNFKINESKMRANLIIIKSIKTSLESLNEEYSAGTKSIIDIVDEEQNLLDAKVNYLNSKRDFLLNYFEIKSLEGSLLNLFDKYLPTIN